MICRYVYGCLQNIKHEYYTNLASSTLVTDKNQKENLGILVQYKVKVKLFLGSLGGDLTAELPFTLMHPKPVEEERPSSSSGSHKSESSITKETGGESSSGKPATSSGEQKIVEDLIDTNLIQLDTETTAPCYADQDDDIIFEDFARLRLKGEMDG